MPAFPFFAALAGIGINQLDKSIQSLFEKKNFSMKKELRRALLTILIFATPIVTSAQLYPHLLSYYSYGVGGLNGAAKMGLETTYWCESYLPAVEYINEHADAGDNIWAEAWSHDVLIYYKLHGQLRDDLNIVHTKWATSLFGDIQSFGPEGLFFDADFVIYQNRQTHLYTESTPITTAWLAKKTPVFQKNVQDQPLVMFFDLR